MKTEWTESDLERMSWHDNHVHGLQIEGGEHGAGLLILDIDYILEWLPGMFGRCSFRIAPATLTFRDVFNLKIDVDWANVTAGMTPFSISQIYRRDDDWTIDINWPSGAITFRGSGFHQTLRAEPIVTTRQLLDPAQRRALAGYHPIP